MLSFELLIPPAQFELRSCSMQESKSNFVKFLAVFSSSFLLYRELIITDNIKRKTDCDVKKLLVGMKLKFCKMKLLWYQTLQAVRNLIVADGTSKTYNVQNFLNSIFFQINAMSH